MIKKCPGCNKEKEMRSNQKYCTPKCKKTFENSLRSGPGNKSKPRSPGQIKTPSNRPQCKGFIMTGDITRPDNLNPVAAAYWDRVAPTIQARGHLNVLSEGIFGELCDLYSRLQELNKNPNLMDDEEEEKKKRAYSRQFLDYCKQFYLTPLSNRGNFGLEDEEKSDPEQDFLNG